MVEQQAFMEKLILSILLLIIQGMYFEIFRDCLIFQFENTIKICSLQILENSMIAMLEWV